MMSLGPKLSRALDRFLFESCDVRIVPLLRIGFACLVIINTLVWMLDAELWFTDAGVLSSATAQHLNDRARWSLLFWLPSTLAVVKVCLSLLLLQSILLLVGCWSRFQMTCIFIWLVSFQHRNPLICDAEDTLFRWFAFLMVFLPLDCGWSLLSRIRANKLHINTKQSATDPSAAWALRLLQLQMTIVYASATWNKLLGSTWRDGTALYYVSHMSDHFGRLPGSTWLFDSLWMVQFQTWAVLVVECLLPIALWIPQTRRLAIALGILLHLGIELTMHLFLFEWIMILGLLSFVKPQSRQRTAPSQHTNDSAAPSITSVPLIPSTH
jgi:hypothetical protein